MLLEGTGSEQRGGTAAEKALLLRHLSFLFSSMLLGFQTEDFQVLLCIATKTAAGKAFPWSPMS